MDYRVVANKILGEWKGSSYLYGVGVLEQIGKIAKKYGPHTLVVSEDFFGGINQRIISSLQEAGIHMNPDRLVQGAKPNAPREDVYRLESYILHYQPDSIIVVGGGSGIDAIKAANVLATLGKDHTPEIEAYFGVSRVSEALQKTGKTLLPIIAVQTSASSGAHLTKYSNITDPVEGQKKLIVDKAIIPTNPVFDYGVTVTMPSSLTVDGAIDGIAHCIEVFYGVPDEQYELVEKITTTALELVIQYTKRAVKHPNDTEAREAIGLATDLGGYAIMIGGTNGAHLTSFSLVDVASHGRACGIMNPYYTVFFAPKIEKQLKVIGNIFKRHGFIEENIDILSGRELGLVVAQGMIAFNTSVGLPLSLHELPNFSTAHIGRALSAAKNPQLKMKLQNMPVALTAEMVDTYMGPILNAAYTGDLTLIRNMESDI
jgi:alcohol dehydrogenase class IV